MTARQYLLQLHSLTGKLWKLHEEIERRRARLESTTISLKLDRVQSSTKGYSMADGVAALADKERSYEDMLWEYDQMRKRIVLQILELEPETYSTLLYKVYVEQKMLKTAAAEMYYSESYFSVLHGKALAAFAAKYPEILNI